MTKHKKKKMKKEIKDWEKYMSSFKSWMLHHQKVKQEEFFLDLDSIKKCKYDPQNIFQVGLSFLSWVDSFYLLFFSLFTFFLLYLPSFLPSFFSSLLPPYLFPPFLPPFLPSFPPSFLPSLPTSLPSYLPSILLSSPSFFTSFLPTYLSICLLSHSFMYTDNIHILSLHPKKLLYCFPLLIFSL